MSRLLRTMQVLTEENWGLRKIYNHAVNTRRDKSPKVWNDNLYRVEIRTVGIVIRNKTPYVSLVVDTDIESFKAPVGW